jgi:hypothetical protein
MLAHAAGLIDSQLQNAFGTGGKIYLSEGSARSHSGHSLNHGLDPVHFQAKLTQNPSGDTTFFPKQTY